MRRGKTRERLSCYVASVARGRPEGKSSLTSRWIVAERVRRHTIGTVEQRLHDIRVDAVMQLELASTGDELADTLTESLPKGKRDRIRDLTGVVGDTFLDKREC